MATQLLADPLVVLPGAPTPLLAYHRLLVSAISQLHLNQIVTSSCLLIALVHAIVCTVSSHGLLISLVLKIASTYAQLLQEEVGKRGHAYQTSTAIIPACAWPADPRVHALPGVNASGQDTFSCRRPVESHGQPECC